MRSAGGAHELPSAVVAPGNTLARPVVRFDSRTTYPTAPFAASQVIVGRTPLVPVGDVTRDPPANVLALAGAVNSNHPLSLAMVTVFDPRGAPSAAMAVTTYVPFGTQFDETPWEAIRSIVSMNVVGPANRRVAEAPSPASNQPFELTSVNTIPDRNPPAWPCRYDPNRWV